MLDIRVMTSSDLSFGEKLSEQAGWNQTPADWQRFFDLQPGGCFVAEFEGQLVGTVTTCVFDRVGWIGMMLVDPSMRGQGIGRALMNRTIGYLESQKLESQKIDAIRLDATPMGEPLYRSLGFQPQYQLTRFAGVVNSSEEEEENVEHAQPPDWEQIATFDETLTGYSRQKLFTRFDAEPNIHALVDQDHGQMLGYVCSRPGRLAAYVGPCVARTSKTGEILLRRELSRYRSQPVFVDVPNGNRRAFETITSVGLAPARELVRMCRGDDKPPESLESLWASGGPAKG